MDSIIILVRNQEICLYCSYWIAKWFEKINIFKMKNYFFKSNV